MSGVNKVIIVGNLGQDPEVRHMPSGDAVATISVATSETWKDKKTGENQERTEWHRIVFYKRLAEVVGEYLSKGSKVYVEGSIHTKKWTDKQGVDRWTTEIHGKELQMLSGKSDYKSSSVKPDVPHKSSAAQEFTADESFDDDVPF